MPWNKQYNFVLIWDEVDYTAPWRFFIGVDILTNKYPFAYVCAPYRGNNAMDITKMREYCRQLYEAGYMPICPFLQFPQFMNMGAPKERKAALEMAQALLRRCRVVVACGKNITDTMLCELMLAQRLRITATTLDGIMAIQSHKESPKKNGEVAH